MPHVVMVTDMVSLEKWGKGSHLDEFGQRLLCDSVAVSAFLPFCELFLSTVANLSQSLMTMNIIK